MIALVITMIIVQRHTKVQSYSLIFLCRLALILDRMALISSPSEILIEILLRRRIFAAAAAVAFAAMAAAVTLFDFPVRLMILLMLSQDSSSAARFGG